MHRVQSDFFPIRPIDEAIPIQWDQPETSPTASAWTTPGRLRSRLLSRLPGKNPAKLKCPVQVFSSGALDVNPDMKRFVGRPSERAATRSRSVVVAEE